MDPRDAKDTFYEQFARVAQAVASPKRIELLDLLAQGERSVQTLARRSAQSVANASAHLQVLREARLVTARRSGRRIYYRIADPAVSRLVADLRGLAERRLPELREAAHAYFGDPPALEPLDREALLAREREGSILLLDVRPGDEFDAGHLPSARSIPLGELEQRLAEIPPDREVVAYCRGPYCVLAKQAVDLLRTHGYPARRLSDGVPEWRAEGLPVEAAGVHEQA